LQDKEGLVSEIQALGEMSEKLLNELAQRQADAKGIQSRREELERSNGALRREIETQRAKVAELKILGTPSQEVANDLKRAQTRKEQLERQIKAQ